MLRALRHRHKHLSLLPDDAGVQYSLAIIHRELGQPTAAIRYLEKAMNNAKVLKELTVYAAELDAIKRSVSRELSRAQSVDTGGILTNLSLGYVAISPAPKQ